MVLLPGLTGGSEDSYVQHAVEHARAAGIRAVVFNSRGTSESPVTTAQFYSSSYTEDLRCGSRNAFIKGALWYHLRLPHSPRL